jgi:palmitoyl-protein thioesterase
MGDSANSEGMTAVRERITAATGAYVVSVYVGKPGDDVRSGFFGRLTEQLASVCSEQLLSDPRLLARGFNAVGFSQGGLFLRALAQTCDVRVRTLVTLGSPHGGVAQVPACRAAGDGASVYCNQMAKLVRAGAYSTLVQGAVVPAQYYRAANDEAGFLQHSLFLAGANNLLEAKNATYADRLAALDRLVLFRFADDATVVPRDSAWFAVQSGAEVVPLEEQELYADDWLGLRALDSSGRLTLAECSGEHMRFTLDWFAQNVIQPYLRSSAEQDDGGAALGAGVAARLQLAAASCKAWFVSWRRLDEAAAASRRLLRQ